MSHLPIERLAELAAEEPRLAEREHLAECSMCSSELVAYQRVVALAADERRRIAPPLTNWGALRQALVADGVIVTPIARTEPSHWGRTLGGAWRAAAAVLLLAGGAVFGRMSVGLPMKQALALRDVRVAGPVAVGGQSDAVSGEDFGSTAAALAALQRAQREYEHAAQYLAASDTSAVDIGPDVYRSRLAALDRMAETSLREIQRRPQDPIMNQVYLTTLGARNLTLTKLGTSLPMGARLTRF